MEVGLVMLEIFHKSKVFDPLGDLSDMINELLGPCDRHASGAQLLD